MPSDEHESHKTEVLCEEREGKAYLLLLPYMAAYARLGIKIGAQSEGRMPH